MKQSLIIFILFGLISCSKDNTEEDTMYGATWKVSYFLEGSEKTSDYAGFYFMFNEDGTLMAHEGPRLTIGRWSESNDKFSILFDTNPLLLKLKGDWRIVEKVAANIKLKEEIATSNKELHLTRQ